MAAERAKPVCPCGREDLTEVFVYREPPEGETRFPLRNEYFRCILRCSVCGHFVSRHEMDLSGLYEKDYVESTYGRDGLRKTFDRIVALPSEKSDNTGRVERVAEFARTHFARHAPSANPRRVLDVGSGLCVFLHRLKAHGFACLALDPDPRAVVHAREVAGVEAVQGDFRTAPDMGLFDIVTFNKVLEHVPDPVAMLSAALPRLTPAGFVYIELPDGESAVQDGPGREEFFIDHYHVFSMASTALLAERAGFTVRCLERLKEPSGKHTIRAMLIRWISSSASILACL